MIKQSLKFAFRRLFKYRTHAVVNIVGLSIGLSCAILIMIWLQNELTYDQFHDDYEQIYRVEFDTYDQGQRDKRSTITQIPLGPGLAEEFAEISSFVRLRGPFDQAFTEENEFKSVSKMFYADSGLFQVFDFTLIKGDPLTALSQPNSIVLTSSAAKIIFNDADPVNQSVLINGTTALIVTGIIADAPDNSHIKYNGFISFETLKPFTRCEEWDCNYSFYTYIKLIESADASALESKFPDFLWEPLNKKYSQFDYREDAKLRPIKEIHLHSKSYEIETGGSTEMIYAFSAIGLFIILIACVNFINLTTAQVSKRSTEIGVKKVSGASRRLLAWQIFGEIALQSLVALILAIISIELVMPMFNNLLGTSLFLSYTDPVIVFGLLGVLTFSVIVSGIYPALVLTSFNPVTVIRQGTNQKGAGKRLRNVLVVFQFIISIVLIASTIIVYNQLQYVHEIDLGYEHDNVLFLPLRNDSARDQFEVLEQRISVIPGIVNIGASTEIPGHSFTQNGYQLEGGSKVTMINVLDIDETYLETMGMEILMGTGFSATTEADDEGYLVNETLVKMIGWDDPIGKWIDRNGKRHEVIGVVKDFHFNTLHAEVAPLIITNKPWGGYQSFGYLSLRVSPEDITGSLNQVENLWQELVPSLPFEYYFMDERLDTSYKEEQTLGKLFIYFTVLAIIISSLGVLGLVMFMIEQKTKEIGVRKVLGASVSQLVFIFSLSFVKKVLIALIVSIPVTTFLMNNWLENFAYRTSIHPIHFILAGGIALSITMITVAVHSVQAAMGNPVNALRTE